jgi:hypothetical protein
MTIHEKIQKCLKEPMIADSVQDDEDFYMDTLNGVGYKTMEDAYKAGVLNEQFGFYLNDGLWVYPNGQIIEH